MICLQWLQYKIKMQATNYTNQLNGYVLGKTIGRGTFGKVKKAIHKLSNEPVAIKCLQKEKIKDISDVQRVSRQLYFLKIVRHPAIAQLYQIIQTQKMIYIVMQFAVGGQYFDYIMDRKIKNQQEAFLYFNQILSALIYLHKLKICHRDVKPQNMLLDTNKRIKLVDFGLSNMYKDKQKLITACGSPCYASPQMIKGDQYDPQLTDVWSLGIVLYTSIMAQLPFQDQNTNSLYAKIKSGLYIVDKKISPQLKDLLSKMINIKPQNRVKLQNILQHPWCRKFNKVTQFQGIDIGFQNIPIDKNIVEQMNSLGFQAKKTIKYLQSNFKNQCTATYYLFLKKHFKLGKASSMDICSQNFKKKLFTMPNTRQKRYKSFDLGKLLQTQMGINSPRINRNCISQFKYRYSSNQKIEQIHISFKKQKNRNRIEKVIINKQKNKSNKSIKIKNKKSIQNFIRKRAESEVKQNVNTNKLFRHKSISVPTEKIQKFQQFLTQNVRQSNIRQPNIRQSNKRMKIQVKNEQQSVKKRMKTDFISLIYAPKLRNKSKQKTSPVKQKVKRNILDLDVSSVYWRKKSTNIKPTTGTSAQYSRCIRKNIIN